MVGPCVTSHSLEELVSNEDGVFTDVRGGLVLSMEGFSASGLLFS
jgi:hypothetical protein